MSFAAIIRRSAATAFLALVAGASLAYAHGNPDQANDPSTGTSYSCGAGGGHLFQGFTPSRRLLASFDLRMRKGGSFPPAGAQLTIRVHEASPAGRVVGTTTGAVSVGDPFTPLVHFDFSPPLALDPAGVFVVEFDTVHPAIVSWMGRDDNPYPGGSAYDCGGSEIPGSDFNFITWVPPDEAPPDVAIDSSTGADSPTRQRWLEVSFSGSDDLSYPTSLTYTCALDGQVGSSCTSPHRTNSLADGRHVLSIQAVDQAGKADATPAVVEWTVDATAPAKPTVRGLRRLRRPKASYRFSARDRLDRPSQLTFRCAFDSRRLRRCGARVTRRLTRGHHILRVVAMDRAGNMSRTTVVRIVRR